MTEGICGWAFLLFSGLAKPQVCNTITSCPIQPPFKPHLLPELACLSFSFKSKHSNGAILGLCFSYFLFNSHNLASLLTIPERLNLLRSQASLLCSNERNMYVSAFARGDLSAYWTRSFPLHFLQSSAWQHVNEYYSTPMDSVGSFPLLTYILSAVELHILTILNTTYMLMTPSSSDVTCPRAGLMEIATLWAQNKVLIPTHCAYYTISILLQICKCHR